MLSAREQEFYIGLVKGSDKKFRWADLAPLKSQDYQNWNQDVASSSDSIICVVFGGFDSDPIVNYQWRAISCKTKAYFVCQKPAKGNKKAIKLFGLTIFIYEQKRILLKIISKTVNCFKLFYKSVVASIEKKD